MKFENSDTIQDQINELANHLTQYNQYTAEFILTEALKKICNSKFKVMFEDDNGNLINPSTLFNNQIKDE